MVGAVMAVALGGASWWADQLTWMGIPEGTWQYEAFGLLQSFGNGPTLWLIGAFVVGAVAGGWVVGPVAATASLVAAVGVYYALIVVATTRPGAELGSAALLWATVAVAAGPIMGAAGAAWSASAGRRRWIGIGVLGGALIGTGLFLLWLLPVAGAVHALLGVAALFALSPPGERVAAALAAAVFGGGAYLLVDVVFALARWVLSPG